MLHLTDFLNEIGVSFLTEGKNVTPGWIEIRCPFCDDPSFHLGISPTNLFHCWRCGEKGNIVKLIMELEGISYYKALAKAGEIDKRFQKDLRQDIQQRLNHNILPAEAKSELTERHREYLRKRLFHPDTLQRKYNLLGVGPEGKFKFRIIAPILYPREQPRPVNFTSLAILGQSPKYIHCSNSEAIIPMKSLLYNIHTVRDTILICEGVTDVWRMGDGCVATMGIEFSKEQIAEVKKAEPKNVFVLYDTEEYAQKQARRLANNLSGLVDHVEVVTLPEGDPGDLSEEDANHLRKELKL